MGETIITYENISIITETVLGKHVGELCEKCKKKTAILADHILMAEHKTMPNSSMSWAQFCAQPSICGQVRKALFGYSSMTKKMVNTCKRLNEIARLKESVLLYRLMEVFPSGLLYLKYDVILKMV